MWGGGIQQLYSDSHLYEQIPLGRAAGQRTCLGFVLCTTAPSLTSMHTCMDVMYLASQGGILPQTTDGVSDHRCVL